MPPFLGFFLGVFSVSKVGLPLMGYTAVQYTDCYSEPMSTRLLNSISSRICRENTQFNMYTTTSKQQEGCTFKDSHPKCFITTNFDKFHCEAFARGGESRWCFDSMFPWCTKLIRMALVIIMILFDVKDYRFLYDSISLSSEKIYTHDSQDFCKCSSTDVFGTKARIDTYRI